MAWYNTSPSHIPIPFPLPNYQSVFPIRGSHLQSSFPINHRFGLVDPIAFALQKTQERYKLVKCEREGAKHVYGDGGVHVKKSRFGIKY